MFHLTIERGSIFRQGIFIQSVRTATKNPAPSECANAIAYLQGEDVLRERLGLSAERAGSAQTGSG